MKNLLCVFGLLCVSLVAAASPVNYQSSLGINNREVRYWGTEIHTVDFFKRAGANGRLWQTQSDSEWDTQEQALLDLDRQGWVRSLPPASSTARYRYATTLIFSGSNFPTGRYTAYYDGEGTLFYGNATRNAALSSPGVDVVDVPAGTQLFYVSVRATDPNKTGNYLRNIRLIAPGGTCNGDVTAYALSSTACPSTFRPFTQTYRTEPFHPLYLNDLMRFPVIRFMHFTGTIQTLVQDWSQRVQPDVASWGGQVVDGSPYEAAIALANTLDASPWLNVPARASDDYVLQFARLVKANITTTRPIYVEYSNETWNGSFPYSIHAAWMQANGVARWPASPLSAYDKQMNWSGMRTSQVCAIWKNVFADQPGRIKCVAGSQLPSTGTSLAVLDCALYVAEGAAPCYSNMDVVAVASYFADYLVQQRFQPIWNTWFSQPDGGIQTLFDEVYVGVVPRAGTPATPYGAFPSIRATLPLQVAIASARRLQLVAYEAGAGFDSAQRPDGDPLKASYDNLQTLMVTASRDRRMERAYKQMLDDWKQSGAGLPMVFSSAQGWSAVTGNAAILEYEGQPRSQSPKYDATLNFIAANPCWWDGCAGGVAGVETTTVVSSRGATAFLGSQVQLTATVAGGAATGVMSFTSDGLSISGCEAVVVQPQASGPTATCSVNTLATGNHAIVAAYSGDRTYRRSTSSAWTQAITDSALDPLADTDGDGIPNGVEAAEGRDPLVKDNDIFSPSTTSARLFVMQQYRDFFSREGDAAGITFWTNQLTSGSSARGQVIESMLRSAEFEGRVAPITRLYLAYFTRIPDYAGLAYWTAAYRSGSSLDAISNSFAQSDEFRIRYGSTDNAQFVRQVYQNVLNRTPDAAGLAYWMGQLNAGTTSRGQVMTAFSESPEFRAAIANQVLVTMTYVGMLRRSPDADGYNTWQAWLAAGNTPASLFASFIAMPEYRSRFLP